MPWMILFGSLILMAITGLFYIVFRFHRFGFIKKLEQKNKILSWAASLIPLFIVMGFGFISAYAAVIVFLHLFVIWLICDLCGFIFRKFKPKKGGRYYSGAAAILITAVYMSYGWFCAHHIFQTDYGFQTEKNLGTQNLRIAAIADSHIGITIDGDDFAEQMKRLQETNPDVVVIAGDYVDDDTKKEDMIKSCKALGDLKTKYGVYFVYGNHDKGYFNKRDFTADDLVKELEKNNVKILEDESVLIDDKFYIIGRQDKQVKDRADMSTLTENLDKSKYMILLDHEPNDFKNEAEAKVDLVFSGHTHGGHMFPAGPIGLLLKANDRNYGTENRNGTNFVVTSGISGWGIPFKTAAISEYVVMDVKVK